MISPAPCVLLRGGLPDGRVRRRGYRPQVRAAMDLRSG